MTGNDAATLSEHLASMVDELAGVAVTGGHEGLELRVSGHLFAIVHRDGLEVALDLAVAEAARRTPDVTGSERGPGWVSFRPLAIDRFALDRADAWLRSAHRGASARR